jgi:hypothetical protein
MENMINDYVEQEQERELNAIAKVQHDIWSHWMEYLFLVSDLGFDGSVTIPSDKVKRWKRQMKTDYDDLSLKEQQSDMDQAIKVIDVL